MRAKFVALFAFSTVLSATLHASIPRQNFDIRTRQQVRSEALPPSNNAKYVATQLTPVREDLRKISPTSLDLHKLQFYFEGKKFFVQGIIDPRGSLSANYGQRWDNPDVVGLNFNYDVNATLYACYDEAAIHPTFDVSGYELTNRAFDSECLRTKQIEIHRGLLNYSIAQKRFIDAKVTETKGFFLEQSPEVYLKGKRITAPLRPLRWETAPIKNLRVVYIEAVEGALGHDLFEGANDTIPDMCYDYPKIEAKLAAYEDPSAKALALAKNIFESDKDKINSHYMFERLRTSTDKDEIVRRAAEILFDVILSTPHKVCGDEYS